MDEFVDWDNCERVVIPFGIDMISFTTPWIDSETGKEVTPIPQVFIDAFKEE